MRNGLLHQTVCWCWWRLARRFEFEVECRIREGGSKRQHRNGTAAAGFSFSFMCDVCVSRGNEVYEKLGEIV